MIRLRIHIPDRRSEAEYIAEGQRVIAAVVAQWPGYVGDAIEPDYHSDSLWLILKPEPDYEMDEGL